MKTTLSIVLAFWLTGAHAADLRNAENHVTESYSAILGVGQTVVEPYHLRIGPDADHWIDLDLKTGAVKMAPGTTQDDAAKIVANAIHLANAIATAQCSNAIIIKGEDK